MKVVQAQLTWGDYHAVLGAEVNVLFECGNGVTAGNNDPGSHTRTVTLLDNGAS